MITGVTGVTRTGGIDLPTPAVRTTSTSRASSSGDAGPAPVDDASTAARSGGTAKPAAAEKPDQQADQQAQRDAGEGTSAAVATSRYLSELLTSRVLGSAAPTGRPSQITPERLASLISYLEAGATSAAAPAAASAKGAPGGVDVTS